MGKIGFVSQKDDAVAGRRAEQLIELTTYIREDQQFALELIENAEIAKSGANDLHEIIREALDMLINERIKAVDMREKSFLKTGGS
jgi:hypothetical protein